MPELKEVTIRVTEETEGLIRNCAGRLYGEEVKQEPLGEVITNFLPDLLQDALNGETMISNLCSNLGHTTDQSEETPEPPMTPEEIHREVEAVATQVEEPDVTIPLEVSDTEPVVEEVEPAPPTLDEILSQPEGQQINNRALTWAKGNPSKEAALAETLWQLPSALWSMARVRNLAERTYEMMRSAKPDA